VPKDGSFVAACFGIGICLFEVIAVCIFFCCNERPELKRKKTKRKCGYIYKESNYKIRGGWALFYPILYQIRFVALVLVIVYQGENVVVQVQVITLMTVFVIALLGNSHPLRPVRSNYT